jgi:peptide/nickel transport system substrate-binding protein
LSRNRLIRFVPAAVVLALAVAGCGSSSSTGSGTGRSTAAFASAQPTSSQKPVSGGTLVYGSDREPSCLDPHNYGDMPQTYIARQYLDSLVSELPDGTVVPWLATSWSISPNGLTYTFHLKHGVKFTDGTPFNAEAVKANFTQELAPATQSGTDLGYIKGYYVSTTTPNPYTAVVHLSRPYSPLLDVLAQAFFGIESPKALARPESANCQDPVGTGPFKVQSWVHGEQVTLVRNPDYNSPPANAHHTGPAYLSEIIWKFLKEPSVRYAAVASGEAQAIFNIPPEDTAAAESNPNLSVLQFINSGNPYNLTLNVSHAPFNQLQVRQAFLYASNVSAGLKSAFFGAFPDAGGPLSTNTPDYDAAFQNGYPYDTAKANALLNAAGWTGRNSQGYRTKDGQELTARLVYSADPGDTPPAMVSLFEDIQAAEKAVGFDLVLKPVPEATDFAAPANPKTYEALFEYWNSPSPAVLYIIFSTEELKEQSGNNVNWVSDPKLDKILLAAAATTDRTTQKQLYDQAQAIASQNAWELTLYPYNTRLAIYKTLHGVWIEPSEAEPVFYDAWLSQ